MATSWEDPPEFRPESSGMPQLALPRLTRGTRALLIVNASVLAASFLLYLSAGGVWSTIVYWLGLQPEAWRELSPFVPVWQLFTYGFLHSVDDLFHLLFNMLTLYFFGTMAERALGYRGTYKLYLLGGVASALLYLIVAAAQGQTGIPLIGASGACYAFLVYAALLAPRSRVIVFFVPVPLGVLASVLVFAGLYSQFVEFQTGYPGGVAHSAHIGGAAFGFVAWRFRWFRDFTPYTRQQSMVGGAIRRLRAWQQARQARSAAADQREVDRILEKIQRVGLPSLSSGERRTLERASDRAKRK
jgi:membrane associated rhomboid family serine protease